MAIMEKNFKLAESIYLEQVCVLLYFQQVDHICNIVLILLILITIFVSQLT